MDTEASGTLRLDEGLRPDSSDSTRTLEGGGASERREEVVAWRRSAHRRSRASRCAEIGVSRHVCALVKSGALTVGSSAGHSRKAASSSAVESMG